MENIATNNIAITMEYSSSESCFSDDEAVSDCDLSTILDSHDVRPYMFEPPDCENVNLPEILLDLPP